MRTSTSRRIGCPRGSGASSSRRPPRRWSSCTSRGCARSSDGRCGDRHRGRGYELRIAPDAVDALRFERASRQARGRRRCALGRRAAGRPRRRAVRGGADPPPRGAVAAGARAGDRRCAGTGRSTPRRCTRPRRCSPRIRSASTCRPSGCSPLSRGPAGRRDRGLPRRAPAADGRGRHRAGTGAAGAQRRDPRAGPGLGPGRGAAVPRTRPQPRRRGRPSRPAAARRWSCVGVVLVATRSSSPGDVAVTRTPSRSSTRPTTGSARTSRCSPTGAGRRRRRTMSGS